MITVCMKDCFFCILGVESMERLGTHHSTKESFYNTSTDLGESGHLQPTGRFVCFACNVFIGSDKDVYIAHCRNEHNINIVACCEFCFRGYRTKAGFVAHMKTHDGDRTGRPKCDVCHIYMRSNAHLIRHMRKHSDERPYMCHVCNRSYKSMDSLQMHRCITLE